MVKILPPPSPLYAFVDEVAMVGLNTVQHHKALGNITPSDVLRGRREEILARRKEVQVQTIDRRRRHNKALRELTRSPSCT